MQVFISEIENFSNPPQKGHKVAVSLGLFHELGFPYWDILHYNGKVAITGNCFVKCLLSTVYFQNKVSQNPPFQLRIVIKSCYCFCNWKLLIDKYLLINFYNFHIIKFYIQWWCNLVQFLYWILPAMSQVRDGGQYRRALLNPSIKIE